MSVFKDYHTLHGDISLGEYTYEYGGKPLTCDLYYIVNDFPGHEPSLLWQFGDNPEEYGSGLIFGWVIPDETHPLVEALRRAEAKGLDVRREHYSTYRDCRRK